VATIMRPTDAKRAAPEDRCWELIGEGVYIDGNATLEQAMPMFEQGNHGFIPVVSLGSDESPPELWGALFQVDALRKVNTALAETAREEHS